MLKLKNVRLTGQPAGQKFSTGPSRAVTGAGYNSAFKGFVDLKTRFLDSVHLREHFWGVP
jgi:hypothetical protein